MGSGMKNFLRALRCAWPYRGRLLVSWIATAGYAASSAGLVHMVEPIFDDVLIRTLNVWPVAATILGLYLFKGVCSYLSTTLVADAGQRAVTDLRNRLYEHVLNQSFAFLRRNSTGSMMSHITTDVEKIQNAVSEMAGDLLKEGLTVLGLVAVLFIKDWRLALLSLVGMPAAFYPLVRLGRHVRASSETSLRRWRDISEILQETISGFPVVKAFGMEGFETSRFRRAASRLFHVNMRITRTTAVLPPLMEAVGGLALVGALFYGSDAVRAGRLTPGAFTSFLAALFAMYTPIKRLSRLNATLQGAMAASGRIFEVLDTHLEVREAEGSRPLPRPQGEIEYRQVGFQYADGHGANVLRCVSFTARAGEVVRQRRFRSFDAKGDVMQDYTTGNDGKFLFRVYENGVPAKTDYFKWSASGPSDGEGPRVPGELPANSLHGTGGWGAAARVPWLAAFVRRADIANAEQG
jgi:subfamily B ATP-binding cassette protein MsbA